MRSLLLTLLAFAAGCTGCVSVPTHSALRATTLRLEFQNGLCSGTAIGPDLILTAKHCLDLGGPLTKVGDTAVRVVGMAHDKHDTLTLRIVGMTFKTWARLGASPTQGSHIFWWGNPEGNRNIYREGYVSRADDGMLVLDATICHGDSGAGIFNMQGEVVGVVTAMSDPNGCTFMLAYPLPTA